MIDNWDVLDFWIGPLKTFDDFPDQRAKLWFSKDPKLDQIIHDQFMPSIEYARKGHLDHWRKYPRGLLSLVILFDQFKRNIFRGKPEAFSEDEFALKLCLQGLSEGMDQELFLIERVFFYLPLEHSEDREIQKASVARFEDLLKLAPAPLKKTYDNFLDYAIRHQEVIERFGRFPHRNEILGRESTAEEIEYLRQPGSGF